MPRLSKGQLAPSIKGLSVAAARSVANRVSEFHRLRASSSPSRGDISVFTTVTSLADWSNESLGITPLSPKTLRKYVNGLYEGGLAQLLRDAALLLGDSQQSLNKKSTNDEVFKLNAQLAVDAALDMTARYLDLLERMKRLSLRSDAVGAELQCHYRRYDKHPHIKVVK
ncbi:hypothetical protein ACOAPY_01845 [Pseudomonas sp. P3C3]